MSVMRATLHVVGTACLAARLLAGSSVLAAESDPVTTARSTASLVSDSDTFGAGHTLRVGLRLRLAPRWHTYWRNPGDAGVAPELTFTWPAGVTASAVEWPVPARQSENDLTTFGYTGDVLLPVEVTVAANAPLPVSLHAEWLVCERVCVPERGDFRLSLAAGPGMPSPQAPLFAAADLHTPRSSPWPARYDPGGTLRLTGADLGPRSVRSAEFLPDDPRVAAGTTQRVAVTEGEVAIGLGPIAGTAPLHGVVVLQDGGGQQSAFEVAALPGPASVAARMGLLRAVGVALLGGLLLNVMPCVFPVLAMKAAGLAGLGGQDRGRARALGLSYLAGVVATFCALGGVLLGLREAGGFGGWGFQFQDPRFVAAMAWVLFLVGLNLSGVFRMGAGRLSGAGQALAGREGHLGSFATGALAVLVASPCTAPFMAAAVAAALAAPPVFALAVFAALGLGLAFPYVLLAWLPGLRLPRPGAWMEVARQALAFPMYATVAWLAWVFLQQTGPDGMPVLAGGLVALALAGWLVGLRQRGVWTLASGGGGGARLGGRGVYDDDLDRVARGRCRRRIHPGAAGQPAPGGTAGVRRHGGGVVRHLPGQRTGGAGAAIGARRLRPARRDPAAWRLDPPGSRHHRLPARARAGRRAALCLLPPRRRRTGAAAPDPDAADRAGGAGRPGLILAPLAPTARSASVRPALEGLGW